MKKRIMSWGILGVALLFFILFQNISFAAQTADNILRPLLGEKNTLFFESIYFNFQDKLSFVHYSIYGQHAPTFTPDTTQKNQKMNAVDRMDLRSIPLSSVMPPLPQEGGWIPIPQDFYPQQTIIARTFIRPDESRPYAIVSLVKMDMKKLGIGIQAGTYYPGGVYKAYGSGIVPKNIQADNTLLAVFNGGFQAKDGQYGMVVGNKTYVPLKKGLPLLQLNTDGSIRFIDYTGQHLSGSIAGLRQNGPYLIQHGAMTPFVEQGLDTWGRSTTNNFYTWRSGVGVTKEGDLVYAVGDSLVPQTLSKALLQAGAVDAIQLDINPPWVRFILYKSLGNGTYTFAPLLASMQGGAEYLHRYNKDFFYVYKK